jgi:hypothetical protein
MYGVLRQPVESRVFQYYRLQIIVTAVSGTIGTKHKAVESGGERFRDKELVGDFKNGAIMIKEILGESVFRGWMQAFIRFV